MERQIKKPRQIQTPAGSYMRAHMYCSRLCNVYDQNCQIKKIVKCNFEAFAKFNARQYLPVSQYLDIIIALTHALFTHLQKIGLRL